MHVDIENIKKTRKRKRYRSYELKVKMESKWDLTIGIFANSVGREMHEDVLNIFGRARQLLFEISERAQPACLHEASELDETEARSCDASLRPERVLRWCSCCLERERWHQQTSSLLCQLARVHCWQTELQTLSVLERQSSCCQIRSITAQYTQAIL